MEKENHKSKILTRVALFFRHQVFIEVKLNVSVISVHGGTCKTAPHPLSCQKRSTLASASKSGETCMSRPYFHYIFLLSFPPWQEQQEALEEK